MYKVPNPIQVKTPICPNFGMKAGMVQITAAIAVKVMVHRACSERVLNAIETLSIVTPAGRL